MHAREREPKNFPDPLSLDTGLTAGAGLSYLTQEVEERLVKREINMGPPTAEAKQVHQVILDRCLKHHAGRELLRDPIFERHLAGMAKAISAAGYQSSDLESIKPLADAVVNYIIADWTLLKSSPLPPSRLAKLGAAHSGKEIINLYRTAEEFFGSEFTKSAVLLCLAGQYERIEDVYKMREKCIRQAEELLRPDPKLRTFIGSAVNAVVKQEYPSIAAYAEKLQTQLSAASSDFAPEFDKKAPIRTAALLVMQGRYANITEAKRAYRNLLLDAEQKLEPLLESPRLNRTAALSVFKGEYPHMQGFVDALAAPYSQALKILGSAPGMTAKARRAALMVVRGEIANVSQELC